MANAFRLATYGKTSIACKLKADTFVKSQEVCALKFRDDYLFE